MTPRKRRRLAFAIALVLASTGGAALVIAALRDNVLYFYSPSDVAARGVRAGIAFHIGGLVARGSVRHVAIIAMDAQVICYHIPVLLSMVTSAA